MKKNTQSLIKLHLAVFLFGFAALFGKFISLNPIVIVFGRTFLAAVTLGIIIFYSKQKFKLNSKRDFLILISNGTIYAIHWFTFFKSVQVSNVAIAVLTFSTFPVFVTFIEPFFFKEKIKLFDIMIALVAFLGVALVIPKFDLSNNFTQGALWGIASGFTCAFPITINRENVKKYSSLLISFYQNLAASIVSIPFLIYLKPALTLKDIMLLILLGTVFTALSNSLIISSLKSIKAQLASLAVSLEPVYAIIFAGLLLKEIPSPKTMLGGLIILSAILIATAKSKGHEVALEH